MKVNINGSEYAVSKDEENVLLQQLQTVMLDVYDNKMDDMRLPAKALARALLIKMENEARRKHGKEQALIFRPDKKKDAVIHLSDIMLLILKEALKDVQVSVSTDTNSVTAISLTVSDQSRSGGPLVTHGDIRERKNDRIEVS